MSSEIADEIFAIRQQLYQDKHDAPQQFQEQPLLQGNADVERSQEDKCGIYTHVR